MLLSTITVITIIIAVWMMVESFITEIIPLKKKEVY